MSATELLKLDEAAERLKLSVKKGADMEQRVINLQQLAAMMGIDSSALRMRMYRSPDNVRRAVEVLEGTG